MDESIAPQETPGIWIAECRNRFKCPKCNKSRNSDVQLGWKFCPFCGNRNVFKEKSYVPVD